ncbi:MAG: glycoside hydrolase family 16 protein [Calditrichia bacterium]
MIRKQRLLFTTFTLTALLLLALGCSDSTGPEDREWTLVWADEFEGAAGQLPDSTKWNFDVGTGWGNAQLEFDTDRPENVSLDGEGHLAIVARKESYMGAAYTSARINTKGLFETQYGRVEARMKLPWGQGIWPAFWMLGSNIDEVGWPNCGEIDIMEYRGQKTSRVHGSLHGPGYSGAAPVTGSFDLPNGRFDLAFHVFAVEWGKEYVEFYVDDHRYLKVDREDVPGPWVYNHPFFIILNLAVGGNYVGPPDATTVFPQTLLVDYVRVYKEK